MTSITFKVKPKLYLGASWLSHDLVLLIAQASSLTHLLLMLQHTHLFILLKFTKPSPTSGPLHWQLCTLEGSCPRGPRLAPLPPSHRGHLLAETFLD